MDTGEEQLQMMTERHASVQSVIHRGKQAREALDAYASDLLRLVQQRKSKNTPAHETKAIVLKCSYRKNNQTVLQHAC